MEQILCSYHLTSCWNGVNISNSDTLSVMWSWPSWNSWIRSWNRYIYSNNVMYSQTSTFASANHKLRYHPSLKSFFYCIKQSDFIVLLIVQMVLRFALLLCLLTSWFSYIKCHRLSNAKLDYIANLSYQGFYCLETITTRNLDDVICGICGTVGEVYLGDVNEKNCCNNSRVRICIYFI